MSLTVTHDSERGSWSLADGAVLAAVKARLLGSIDDPPRLGRYEIEGPLGAGAMGRILLAHDPELDRRVALKLITPALAHDPQARARIVREARAMAKLSDPHVAQVYEVVHDEPQLFVAMEHVDGQALRAWLDERPRPWAEIVDVFVQAGRGLAAAHDKGLAHRDFKPDNVVLEHNGRAKVVDFGLARDLGEAELEHTPWPGAPATVTATGTWIGTPAYMAPEQWDGRAVDARSDQFSFCVALYEALARRRPFEGDTASEIQRALRRDSVPPLPRGARIPRRIEAAIRRGLERSPDRRWPSMEPLLRALAPPSRGRWMPIVAVGSVAVTVAVLMADPSDRCATAGDPIDAVWNDDVRARTAGALAAMDVPWAEPTRAAILGRLDRAREGWREAAQTSCAAGDPPPERSACLDYARARIGDVIAAANRAEPSVMVGAVADVELLVDARTCLQSTSLAWLRERPSAVDDEHAALAREQLEVVARTLGELSVGEGASRYVAALAAGREAAARARTEAEAAGDRPLLARAAWMQGRLAIRDGSPTEAEAALRLAMDVALEVGDGPLRAAAAIELSYLVGNDRDRTAEALGLARDAESMLGAVGDRPMWSARLAAHQASTLAHAAEPQAARAVELHREAVGILRALVGDSHPDLIVELGNLGSALSQAQRFDEARVHLGEALARAREVWGERHPRTARLEGTLGWALARQGDLPGAREHLERSLQARIDALGPDHDEVASARYNLAMVMRQQGDHDAAIEQLTRGLQTRERLRGPDDPGHAEWLQRIGISELARGRPVDARAPLHRALQLSERFGAGRDTYANLRVSLARAYAQEDPAKARVFAELARREWIDVPHERVQVDALLEELGRAEAALRKTPDGAEP